MPADNSLERRNPLPPGRYWITIDPKHFAAFIEWKKSSALIRVEASEAHTEPEPFEFNVFRVLAPGLVPWPTEFGFPSIAGEKVQSFGDVISAPVIEEPDPKAVADKLIDLAKVGLFAATLIALVKIFGKK